MGSGGIIGAGEGIVPYAAAKEIAAAATISAAPVEIEIIPAMPGSSLDIKERTHIVSTVAGIEPAAKSAATLQSTLPLLEWMAVPAVFVTAA